MYLGLPPELDHAAGRA
jgi:hypothetical protein